MDLSALLVEFYGRIPPLARAATEGVPTATLVQPPAPGVNTIAWLVWHAARVEDHHVSEVAGVDQLWASGGWAAAVGLAPDPTNTGYGHTADDVQTVRPSSADDLLGYLDAVHARTVDFLVPLSATDLDRIVDRRWDPPVTLGVRLVSVADDGLQHVGQAAYARGMLLS